MSYLKNISILVALLIAFYLGSALKPTVVENKKYAGFELEKIIPLEFSDWKNDDTLPIVLVSPEEDALLEMLYSQMVTRTYVNSKNQRVMLSISYGDIQDRSKQLHFPEVCYPAQGFEIIKESKGFLSIDKRNIPVKRLDTRQGARIEYVTYWVRVGDDVLISRIKQKIVTVFYGLQGVRPDGLLFRVSTINLGDDYLIQDEFISNLISSVPVAQRSVLLGVSP